MGTPVRDNRTYAATKTTGVDLNSTGSTDIYDPSVQAMVYGAYLRNGGGTAEVSLEATDGTDTITVLNNRANGGGDVEFTGPIVLDSGWKLQVNVTTAEGTAQTNDAVVFKAEKD